MKKYFLLLLLASPVYFASAQDSKTPYYSRSLSNDGIKQVFVSTSGGSISVSGAGVQQPHIDVYVTGNNNQGLTKDEIKKRLEEDYILDIDIHDGELHATAKSRRNNMNWRRSLSIGFKIYVNKQTATSLNTSGGSLHLDNLTGEQTFETSGGSISVDKLTGPVKGETSGGSISVSNTKPLIDLQTSGGSITALNCDGNIKLETSGGSLSLTNLKGKVNAQTSGGSVRGNNIDGELTAGTSGGSVNLSAISGSVDASTSAGGMHVQMLRVDKFVKIDANSGHVDLELPANQGVDVDLRGNNVNFNINGKFEGHKEKERVNGKLNGGGPMVEVRGDGTVNVSFK
ncbi:DUF4097 family beta strand repeat-containing protein [Mucilaginibacter phyllosphaerae]|uniref:DUF4097 and DUF4098 domain-containing protein YvlB n=1 Tax=Mucilaginibacter phyllosphaerae TaxID=1812349 RepID=A0A4Y8A719_9SPHI|nr:DUF4097 family beta strand repeat-containing protein [Mucilaginibacter phyllosphaerae]MBB3970875.1 DUF4097 and DUF4098 domain-containing protein YvlB [Mucilaginibacter phyllosphaerae]TEW64190.1 hypothetical protein E2R65_17735 [Mucilaginibacter phyllosphaerae]GGH05151.1 hypothetical protein GCM10007352_08770 [Mucilaginibacter phyllosphaerae]